MRLGFYGGRHGRDWHAVRGTRGFGGFGAFGEREEGGGGGRRRVFDGGDLRLVLLRLIADAPRHGYDLIRAIEERTGGAYAPSPGVVYPTLTLLADMDQIAEQPGAGARKVFAVTPEGERVLAERADEVSRLMARLDALAAERGRGESAPLRRAVHNLRAVLVDKLAAGLDEDRLHEAVAMIDDAARRIERL